MWVLFRFILDKVFLNQWLKLGCASVSPTGARYSLGPAPRISDSVGLRWLISNKFPPDAAVLGCCFENYCVKCSITKGWGDRKKDWDFTGPLTKHIFFLLQSGSPLKSGCRIASWFSSTDFYVHLNHG